MASGTNETPKTPAFRMRLHPLGEPRESAAPGPESDGPMPAAASGVDDKDALRLFHRAAQLEPNDADYHYIVGLALSRVGRFAEAAAAFREAVSLHRSDPDYCHAYGTALWEVGDDEKAADAFRDVLRLRPDDPWALNGLGCALARTRRDAEAIALFHEALGRTRDADVHGNLAIALWHAGRHDVAVKSLRTAVARAPRDAFWRRQLALALSAQGRHDDAAASLRAIPGYRGNTGLLVDLAEALYDAGRFVAADAALHDALKLDSAVVAGRARTHEIRSALQLKKLRQELKGRPARSPAAALLLAIGDGLGRLVVPRSLPSAVFVIALALAAYVGVRVARPYVIRYLLFDEVAAIAGAPVSDDADIYDRLDHAVRERGMEAYLTAGSCTVRTRPKWRRIVCRYDMPVELLPGVRQTLHFKIDVERPYLTQPETLYF